MQHTNNLKTDKKEYVKFAAVMLLVTGLAYLHAEWVQDYAIATNYSLQFMESFMGVFFVVFASFKLYRLKEFAYGLQTYETLQDKPLSWGYAYPFIQVLFGSLYLFGLGSTILDAVVFLWSAYGSYIVLLTLRKKGDVHCLCLGGVIKLPLSTLSFIEDFGMSVMALAMILMR